ncbi:MAG: Hsp70 family protein, partial [Verrucomicrobiota bacterium]
MTSIVGIDFGTTNSVVSRLTPDGAVHSQRFRLGSSDFDVFRTVLCFAAETRQGLSHLRHHAGPAAIGAYLDDPTDSRLIMSMKTYLAQRSFVQTRIFGRNFSLEEMIAVFLRTLLEAAGLRGPEIHVVAG